MTLFSSLSPEICLLLEGFLFIAVFFELSLCIYRYISARKIGRCIKEVFILVILTLFLSFAAETARMGKLSDFSFNVPWILFPVLSVFIIIHSVLGITAEIRANRNRLSKESVREAVDNLSTGVMFADESGKVVLSNSVMNDAVLTLTGSYPQTVDGLKDAIASAADDKGLTPVEGLNDTFLFPDGKVLAFRTEKTDGSSPSGFTLITARDISEIYLLSEKLKKENDALRESNDKIKKTHLLIGDRIKEKEALDLKVRVHNDIGSCLDAVSDILNGNGEQDAGSHLRKLCSAVSSLGDSSAG